MCRVIVQPIRSPPQPSSLPLPRSRNRWHLLPRTPRSHIIARILRRRAQYQTSLLCLPLRVHGACAYGPCRSTLSLAANDHDAIDVRVGTSRGHHKVESLHHLLSTLSQAFGLAFRRPAIAASSLPFSQRPPAVGASPLGTPPAVRRLEGRFVGAEKT